MDNQLSTELFYGMILTGAKQVIMNEGELNQLNVFPVADRDTGTNLASMMRYIVDNLSITKDSQELLHQLSQHGLVGCSGNSGLIFSQFFYGLTKHELANKAVVKLQEFASMISDGYKSAYSAVSHPKPGTILTVMEYWAKSYHELVKNTSASIVEIFQNSVEQAREALKNTMNQLEVLRHNNVVDAGAQGFIHFIEGMLIYLKAEPDTRNKLLEERESSDYKMVINHEFEEIAELPDCRYCFEMVLRTKKDSHILEDNRAYLEELGDSMVIGRAPQMEKLHIHTDNPGLITQHLSSFGDVLYQKIDDMVMQFNIANHVQNDVAIVIDSMSDVPLQWIRQNNIFTFPLQVKVNNNSFLDKFAINFRDTVDYLNSDNVKVGTSAPSAAIVSRGLHFLSQHYKGLIIIPIAKSLSSTYDVIVNQARKIHDCTVRVIDSCMISGALGLLVVYANQLVRSKQYPLDEMVKKIEQARERIHLLVFINSMDELVKSGRLPKSAGFIAKFLRLKPIVKLDSHGKPKIISVALSKNAGWKKMAKIVNRLKSNGEIKSLAVVHSSSEEAATNFKNYIMFETNLKPLFVAEASSVAVAHTGKNGVSIAYSTDEIQM